jgi:hypothetical protein
MHDVVVKVHDVAERTEHLWEVALPRLVALLHRPRFGLRKRMQKIITYYIVLRKLILQKNLNHADAEQFSRRRHLPTLRNQQPFLGTPVGKRGAACVARAHHGHVHGRLVAQPPKLQVVHQDVVSLQNLSSTISN